mmetsp:Transcript_27157/g.51701  ORF Transcript_27157/g.51701 Transcript_27157/m.51701 type:complete len:272 (+) Transcript_27157:1492-2307(+)
MQKPVQPLAVPQKILQLSHGLEPGEVHHGDGEIDLRVVVAVSAEQGLQGLDGIRFQRCAQINSFISKRMIVQFLHVAANQDAEQAVLLLLRGAVRHQPLQQHQPVRNRGRHQLRRARGHHYPHPVGALAGDVVQAEARRGHPEVELEGGAGGGEGARARDGGGVVLRQVRQQRHAAFLHTRVPRMPLQRQYRDVVRFSAHQNGLVLTVRGGGNVCQERYPICLHMSVLGMVLERLRSCSHCTAVDNLIIPPATFSIPRRGRIRGFSMRNSV